MKKQLIAVVLVGAFMVVGVPYGHAQTTDTASLAEQIQELLAKVQDLQRQLNDLRGGQQEIRSELRETRQLTRSLFRGLSGEDVTELQELLASDESIYPEGLVTGFFGPLTERAIQRLQARVNLPQVGRVGPLTLAQINELFEGVGESSGTIPPGFLKFKLKVKFDNDGVEIRIRQKCDSSGKGNICNDLLDDDEKSNPARLCSAELAAAPGDFVEQYGENDNKRNAFGKCVSEKAQELDDDEDEDEEEDEGVISGTKTDDSETGREGWTIFLDENDNQTLDDGEESTETDSDGDYSFTDLAAGDYTVCEVQQDGWTQLSPSDNDGCNVVEDLASDGTSEDNDFVNEENDE